MKNLKIGMRLALGFGVVMLLMMAITFIGISRLAAQNNSADNIVNNLYLKAAAARNISHIAVDTARIVRDFVLHTGANAMAADSAALNKNRGQITDLLDRLDKAIDTDTERDLMKAIMTTRALYVGYTQEVVELGLKNDSVAANEILYGPKYHLQTEYLEALGNMVAFQEKQMMKGVEQNHAVYQSALMLMLGLGLAALLIAAFFAFWITRSITRPMRKALEITETVAAGDLTSRIDVSTGDETGLQLRALHTMNGNLAAIVANVRGGIETIAAASSQIAAGNMDLSARTEQQASQLEETASSMEELTSTVKQNADNARQAHQLAVSASDAAINGGAVALQVVETMGSIKESANKVADVIGVIDGIAFQVNILALNAAVEAARAGEQGRGFAVVATEVRNLAQRAAVAAKEIKMLVGDAADKVVIGIRLADQAGVSMQEIVESAKRVTDIMGEITSATQGQAAGIDQVNQAITQMDEVTQQNAALVEEAAAAAESLQEQAVNLSQAVSVFKLGDVRTTAPVTRTEGRSLPPSRIAPAAGKSKVPALASGSSRSRPAPAAAGDEWDEF